MCLALPKSTHPAAKKALAEICNAEDKTHALAAVNQFTEVLGAKFGTAVAKITDDLDELLAFYDYPAQHWVHLRTTDEIVNGGIQREGFRVGHGRRRCPGRRPAASVKVELPAGRTTLTEARTAVACGCGGRWSTAERRAARWDCECCRAA
jgi:Transposase, Mutator family